MSKTALSKMVSMARKEKERADDETKRKAKFAVTEEHIFSAWEVLSPAGHSTMSKHQLLDSLQRFFPNMDAKEVKHMLGPGNSMSVDKIRHLLFKQDCPDFDPNAEAFKMLDPEGTGCVDIQILKKFLLQMPGVDALDDQDMQLLVSLVDSDHDGVINLQDFANIGTWTPPKETVGADARKKLSLQ